MNRYSSISGGQMNNKEELKLYIPQLEELGYYKSQLSDPLTMSYNAPWFPPDGCIDFPREEWDAWYSQWIGQEPKRFFAYLQKVSDGSFIGYVNFHYNPTDDYRDMGILISASERAKGYSKRGLKLLLDRAFLDNQVRLLHNSFEKTRSAAYKTHKSLGFIEVEKYDEYFHLFLSREDYLEFLGSSNEKI